MYKKVIGIEFQENSGIVGVASELRHGRLVHSEQLDLLRIRRAAEQGIPLAAALSARESFARWIETHFANAAKARKVLPTILDIQLPFPLEDCVYQFLCLRKPGPKEAVRALAVAARREAVQKKLAVLQAENLDPMFLDQESLALWTQSLEEAPPSKAGDNSWRVVVHLGSERATVVIGKAREFINSYCVPSNDAAQINRVLTASLPTKGPAVEWFWSGPGAEDRRVADIYTQLADAWPGSSVIHNSPQTFLARAVAARAITRGPYRCNLRLGSLAHPAIQRQTHRRALYSAITATACGLTLCAASLFASFQVHARETAFNNYFRRLANDVAGYDIGGARGQHAVRIAREAATNRLARLKPFVRAFQPSRLETLVQIVNLSKKADLTLASLTMTPTRITLSGTARNWNACDPVLDFLKLAGYRVKFDRQEPVNDTRITFSITAENGDEQFQDN